MRRADQAATRQPRYGGNEPPEFLTPYVAALQLFSLRDHDHSESRKLRQGEVCPLSVSSKSEPLMSLSSSRLNVDLCLRTLNRELHFMSNDDPP
jgi:hypothetical protein